MAKNRSCSDADSLTSGGDEVGAVLVAERDGLVDRLDDVERHLGRPSHSHSCSRSPTAYSLTKGSSCTPSALDPHGSCGQFVRHVTERRSGGVDAFSAPLFPASSTAAMNVGTRSAALADDAAHVEGVAHLAVERVADGEPEPFGVGVGCGDHPRPARAVQRHRDAR
ncbi:MAG: hypothetical protein R2697_05055 [Ilumatobacteraceae bacterium]